MGKEAFKDTKVVLDCHSQLRHVEVDRCILYASPRRHQTWSTLPVAFISYNVRGKRRQEKRKGEVG